MIGRCCNLDLAHVEGCPLYHVSNDLYRDRELSGLETRVLFTNYDVWLEISGGLVPQKVSKMAYLFTICRESAQELPY